MKIVIFLAALSAANIFVGVEGPFPFLLPPEVRIAGSGELQVTFPKIFGVEIFAFHGNRDKPITVDEPGSIEGPVSRRLDGRWIYTNASANVQPKDKINYWLGIRHYGRNWQTKPRYFIVPAVGKYREVDW